MKVFSAILMIVASLLAQDSRMQTGSGMVSLLPTFLMFAIIYFFVIKPRRKKRLKEIEEKRKNDNLEDEVFK